MTLSDTIADFLTRVRNAKDARHKYVDVPFSRLHRAMSDVMKENGFIEHYLVDEKKYKVRIFLKYKKKTQQPVIQNLKRISKPGKRAFVGVKAIPRVLSGLGIAILSTPFGVMEGEKARLLNVGGEVLCFIW